VLVIVRAREVKARGCHVGLGGVNVDDFVVLVYAVHNQGFLHVELIPSIEGTGLAEARDF
jgi:hypothetical protein